MNSPPLPDNLALTTPLFVLQGLDSDLDSEVSSLMSYDHELKTHLMSYDHEVKNLHLISPLEYAAMLKQVCYVHREINRIERLHRKLDNKSSHCIK